MYVHTLRTPLARANLRVLEKQYTSEGNNTRALQQIFTLDITRTRARAHTHSRVLDIDTEIVTVAHTQKNWQAHMQASISRGAEMRAKTFKVAIGSPHRRADMAGFQPTHVFARSGTLLCKGQCASHLRPSVPQTLTVLEPQSNEQFT